MPEKRISRDVREMVIKFYEKDFGSRKISA